MSDIWEGATWNKNGELIANIYKEPPRHTYKEIDCDGERGWGKHRVWLEPSKKTDTFGRGGFYVHGGWEPGSNGCIDLTSQMDDFTKWFENNGHDLIVNVKYE